MAEDWPFLHLNIISPPIERLASDGNQELSLLPFDSSHLEAWTNINFRFDPEPPTTIFNTNDHSNPTSSSSDDPPSTINLTKPSNNSSTRNTRFSSSSSSSKLTSTSNNDPFQSSHELPPFRLSNDPMITVASFTEHPSNPLVSSTAKSSNSSDPDRSVTSNSDQPLGHSPDAIINSSSIAPIHPSSQIDSKVYDSSSLFIHNHTSPNTNSLQVQISSNPKDDDDDANRMAHEEDKRRRNTLASARFRMKKKMKEQETERTAREMRERVSELEKEVDSLKQENKWLRGLIVDSTASKLVTAQAQEKIELAYVDSCQDHFKRPRPIISTSDSIHVPSHYQKRPKLNPASSSSDP